MRSPGGPWLIAAAIAICIVLPHGALAQTAAGGGQQATTAERTQAELDKLRAEREKLRAEAKKLRGDDGFWGRFGAYGAVLAALVALGTLAGTLRKQQSDARAERDKDRQERDRERVRRFDEQFAVMVTRLTSIVPAERASAAASIRAFLKDEHRDFHEQVVSLLGANLKFPQGNDTDRVIERVFADALKSNAKRLPEVLGGARLDLYKAQLRRVDLSGLDLDSCDMIEANLHGVIFEGASLKNARGLKVDLSEAVLVRANLQEARLKQANLKKARLGGSRLVSTKLDEAQASGAAFDGAQMQEANLDNADLRAASFNEANLNNAFFRGARFDESALRSIVCAENWRKGNFDPEVLQRLEELAPAEP